MAFHWWQRPLPRTCRPQSVSAQMARAALLSTAETMPPAVHLQHPRRATTPAHHWVGEPTRNHRTHSQNPDSTTFLVGLDASAQQAHDRHRAQRIARRKGGSFAPNSNTIEVRQPVSPVVASSHLAQVSATHVLQKKSAHRTLCRASTLNATTQVSRHWCLDASGARNIPEPRCRASLGTRGRYRGSGLHPHHRHGTTVGLVTTNFSMRQAQA